MNFIMSLRHKQHGGYLGKSAYGNKRSALFHLFRLHNRTGFSDAFRLELGNLYRGFFRQLQLHRRRRIQAGAATRDIGEEQQHGSDVQEEHDRALHKEGKDALSIDLYLSLCGWFLDWGTINGVFAHCFLVLTWNLACRSENTANIRMNQVTWSTSFDSFEIFFGHTKTDQTGDDSKYPRHCYANPLQPLCCPVLALSLYFSSSFNTQQESDFFLFPGNRQNDRFAESLRRCLQQHKREVVEKGFAIADIGTHSIRKGAVSYLASLVGGPPAAAICIRAGWTMGRIRDIYMRYLASGDEFVGRSLSLLPIHSASFGASPPHFNPNWEDWGMSVCQRQFPMVYRIPHLHRLLLNCVASMLHHYAFLKSCLPPNHVSLVSSVIYRDASIMATLESNHGNIVHVLYPWNDHVHAFSGIPPHITVLQELTYIRQEQRSLIDTFVDKVRLAIDQSGLSGSGVTEDRLQRLFDRFAGQLRVQLDARIGERFNLQNQEVAERERVETGLGYRYHSYGGKFHKVPEDWRFPRVGVLDAWRQWWIGDTVRSIPPLNTLKGCDVSHLDALPLGEEELQGRSGSHSGKRRPASKVLSDLSFLMKHITEKVVAAGAMPDEITLSSVDKMFDVVVDEFGRGHRDAQKKWLTVVREVRKKLKEQDQGGNRRMLMRRGVN